MDAKVAATAAGSKDDHDDDNSSPLDPVKVKEMITACEQGQMHVVHALMEENVFYARQQEETTGRSPLMAAAQVGNGALCQYLLDAGAPWNAVDRRGYCAGNYATDQEHWGVVNLLVDWGVRAELILGTLERNLHGRNNDNGEQTYQDEPGQSSNIVSERNDGQIVLDHSTSKRGQCPVEQEPSTKPNYLQQRLSYTDNGRALIDSDRDAVMMEWERPLMKAHAQILMQNDSTTMTTDNAMNNSETVTSASPVGKTVMNIGFGMGIIDSILQEYYQPSKHYIVEAHPDVYQRMKDENWDEKPNVVILFGRWQDVLPPLLSAADPLQVDAIFFDTYGEHFMDLQDFHTDIVTRALKKPHGIYSFFNGLAPDNLFFHGVACQCVKLQLSQIGLDAEFYPCEFQGPDNEKDTEWEGIRRPYWFGRNVYYLPHCTWNADFLVTGTVAPDPLLAIKNKVDHACGDPNHADLVDTGGSKRPKVHEE